MKIKTRDKLYNVLSNAGYAFNFTDRDGWIKSNGNKIRFHIYVVNDNQGDMHMDKTVNGYHKLLWCPSVMSKEKQRIKTFDSKIPSDIKNQNKIPRKGLYAENYRELIKTKVIKRSWYNPLRYIKGKFKYIKLSTV